MNIVRYTRDIIPVKSPLSHLFSYYPRLVTLHEKQFILFFLFLLSAIPRWIVLVLFEESGGDGPRRATIAYLWSQDPSIQLYGVWPPGFMYLSGAFGIILSDPVISTRILNVFLGSLTIPFFYLLVCKVWDRKTALLSASVLALFPLHVALSGTSLTEVSVVFEIIAGMFFLLIGSESSGQRKGLFLSLSILLLCLATMTRYEAWIVVPLVAAYYFWKTRRLSEALLVLLVLIAFPISWVAGNLLYTGSILPGYDAAIIANTVERPFGQTSHILAILARNYIGYIALLAGAFGLAIRLYQGIKSRLSVEEVFYLVILCSTALFMLKFSMDRQLGLSDAGRYFLLIFILMIPLISLPFLRYLQGSLHLNMVFFLFLAGSIAFSSWLYRPTMYIMREHPQENKRLAVWLKNSAYNKGYLLTTDTTHGSDSLLGLYNPDCRYFPVGYHHIPVLKAFIKIRRPSLLIASKGRTTAQRNKLLAEEILGTELGEERLVHTVGPLQIFDLTGLITEQPSSEEIKLLRKFEYTGGLFALEKDW